MESTASREPSQNENISSTYGKHQWCRSDVKPELHGISLHSYFLVNTTPTGMGVDVNVKILDSFATHVAPALGWQPNRESPVTSYPIA